MGGAGIIGHWFRYIGQNGGFQVVKGLWFRYEAFEAIIFVFFGE